MATGFAKVFVVVPTYNEAENVQKLITDLLALPVTGLEVLIVDDGSPDGTGNMVDTLAASDERVHCLHRSGKQGLGTAYVAGFRWALMRGAEVVIQMDADFSHSPRYIPDMLAALVDCDSVIGSRYAPGGKLDERWSIWRKLLSWWANSVWVHLILRTPVHDNTGGFRAWRRDTLIGINLDQVRSNGYVFQVELTYIAYRLGYTFREVPIYFEDRQLGTSKMGLAIQIEAALGVFSLFWRYRGLTKAQRATTL
jgi:dolichol-phosphate mannosyltransferase